MSAKLLLLTTILGWMPSFFRLCLCFFFLWAGRVRCWRTWAHLWLTIWMRRFHSSLVYRKNSGPKYTLVAGIEWTKTWLYSICIRKRFSSSSLCRQNHSHMFRLWSKSLRIMWTKWMIYRKISKRTRDYIKMIPSIKNSSRYNKANLLFELSNSS